MQGLFIALVALGCVLIVAVILIPVYLTYVVLCFIARREPVKLFEKLAGGVHGAIAEKVDDPDKYVLTDREVKDKAAALKAKGDGQEFVIDRSEAYIGVMIDDLITKGVDEPYRMFTSRSEYRLLLRADNADLRLTEKGHDIGVVGDERYTVFKAKKAALDKYRTLTQELSTKHADIENIGLKVKQNGTKRTAYNLMSYDSVSRETINHFWPELASMPDDIFEQLEIEARYSGYIKRQEADIEVFKKDEKLKIRDDIDYSHIGGLSREMVQKLTKVKPSTIGEASRIPGVTPAAIAAILGFIKKA